VPDSFAARQFEIKIVSGEMMGFNTSSNSFAALIVLVMIVGVGAIIQRQADRDSPEWIVSMVLPMPLACWLLVYTQSKAGMITPVLGVGTLWAIARWRGVLATRPAKCFYLGLAGVLCAMAAVVGFGMVHHGLPTSSLNFRWRYWTATWRMFLRHPIRGIGWANFGPHYLRDRLPAASEEIRDPHDFLIRFFVELGLIGGTLAVAWMIRLWWELTRPITPPPPVVRVAQPPSRGAAGVLFGVAALSMAIAVAASLDFAQDPGFITIELLKRSLFLCALGVGAILVALRSLQDPRLDDRPAPWILYGLLVSLGLFLIHNLIEFSLFEAGPMCLFGLLCGAALGARQPTIVTPRSEPRAGAAFVLAIGALAWLAAGIFVWFPVAQAETLAQSGDEALRSASLQDRSKFEEAATDYQEAFARWKWNADYTFRAGRALQIELDSMLAANQESQIPVSLRVQILSFYTTAISRDPSNIAPYLQRAALALQVRNPDQVIADFNRVVYMNPNDVGIRLDYARALGTLRMPERELEQLRLALFYNSQLDASEPKRLPQSQVDAIQRQIAALSN